MSTFLCFLIKFPVQTFNKLGMINSAPCSPTAKLTNMAILLNRLLPRLELTSNTHPDNFWVVFPAKSKNKVHNFQPKLTIMTNIHNVDLLGNFVKPPPPSARVNKQHPPNNNLGIFFLSKKQNSHFLAKSHNFYSLGSNY